MQKSAGVAALFSALMGVVTLFIVLVMVGPALAYAPGDSTEVLAALVRTNPAPLIALEALKVLTAFFTLVIVIALRQRLIAHNAPNLHWGMLSGFAGSALLSLSGLVGIFAIAQSGRVGAPVEAARTYQQISDLVTYIGLFALLGYGIWYLLTASAAIRKGGLPLRLAYFTFLLGVVNVLGFFMPPLAILVLLIGLAWNIAYGLFVLGEEAPA